MYYIFIYLFSGVLKILLCSLNVTPICISSSAFSNPEKTLSKVTFVHMKIKFTEPLFICICLDNMLIKTHKPMHDIYLPV